MQARKALPEDAALLAVDLGVRTGYAYFSRQGLLCACYSRNFGSAARLKKAIPHLLEPYPRLEHLVLEGGGPLAEAWTREARRRGLAIRQMGAEAWRKALFFARMHRTGMQAKSTATVLARRVIVWSGLKRPTALRHDAAEAVLLGLHAVLELGWLTEMPDELRPHR